MADFSVQIISAFVKTVSVLHDSIVCCWLEVGTWLSDSTSTASAPSTVLSTSMMVPLAKILSSVNLKTSNFLADKIILYASLGPGRASAD